MLENETDPEMHNIVNDIMASIVSIKETNGLTNLTESMKNSLNSGLSELQSIVSLRAFEYFKINDFDPTTQIVPIMRIVVKTALEKGVL